MGFVQLSLLTLQTYNIIHMQLWITGLLLAMYITMVLPVIPRYQMFNRRNYRVYFVQLGIQELQERWILH